MECKSPEPVGQGLSKSASVVSFPVVNKDSGTTGKILNGHKVVDSPQNSNGTQSNERQSISSASGVSSPSNNSAEDEKFASSCIYYFLLYILVSEFAFFVTKRRSAFSLKTIR